MEYNTQRPQLKITDYGRNVVKLIEQAKQLPTKQQRNAAAHTIVRTMAQVNPKVRHTDNYKRELWEHLMILSDWQLDVDCPYALTPQERVSFQPHRIQRQKPRIQFRHYGRCIEEMAQKVASMPEGREREMLTALLIAQMKKSYVVWNRTVQDNAKVDDYNDVVLAQLDTLSQGRLKEGSIRLRINPHLARPSLGVVKKKSNKKNKKKRYYNA